MKKLYRGWEVEAYRSKSLGGDTLLYYSLFDPEGYEIDSGFYTGTETPREFMGLLCKRVDEEMSAQHIAKSQDE